ncbi:MAG: GNAT family N-acetyltransferase [Clostridia bacterium]|nr:GNAT family N-acetyltransferase [Clostridia bacterium]
MEIIEFNLDFEKEVKDLLCELQEYIVLIDEYKLNIITPEYREKYLDITLKELSLNNGKMFLAKENSEILGLICGYIYTYEKDDTIDYKCPKKCIISELIVSSKHRKKGIGQKLVDYIELYFKSLGCEYSQIDVFAYNKNAKKLYEKNGYSDRLITMSKKL